MAPPPRKLIAGNWKMNGRLKPALAEIRQLARLVASGRAERAALVVCPPASLIMACRETLRLAGGARRIALGGQDCHAAASGAHTGDLSAEMVADAGARYVILGHSERRADHGESDDQVRAKTLAAHRAGLTAIICVGETLAEREAGQARRVVSRQIARSLPAAITAADTVIAYEPVWAIGTGHSASAADILRIHAHIRRRLERLSPAAASCRILYGGSVKPANAAEILALANVDGALVGGASLEAAAFFAIAEAASRPSSNATTGMKERRRRAG